MKTELTRRNFVLGTAVGAAGIATAGLAACTSQNTTASSASAASQEESSSAQAEAADVSSASAPTTGSDYASRVTDMTSCDIVVVGAGMSGLTASVQALLEGADVITLESMPNPGGNGNVTSNVMGVGTKMQEDLGITVTPAEIIETEMETFNYAADGYRWKTLIANSADNIEWLQEQGCTFETVDNYHGAGLFSTAHEWTEDAGRTGATGYVAPMVARVEELGGQVLTSTAGKEIIMDGNKVAGIYAETDDGVLQIDCKAVIIATGGYANNQELLEQKGYDFSKIESSGLVGHNGDGIMMAIAAGGKSWLDESCLMEYPMNPTIGGDSRSFANLTNAIWVNGSGSRFANEACGIAVPARPALAIRTQEESYILLTQAMIDERPPSMDGVMAADVVAEGTASGAIFAGDTIEEVAKAAGLDADALVQTIEEYNGYCADGADPDFGKPADQLVAYENGPFYLMDNTGISYLTTIGGIDTTATCEVRSADGNGVVDGLYAVGVDGVENYRGCYTIDIPGSCNANNINSGRTAALQAVAYL